MKYQTGDFLWLSSAHSEWVAEHVDLLSLVRTKGASTVIFNGAGFEPVREYYIDIETREVRHFFDEKTLAPYSRAQYEKKAGKDAE